MNHDNEGVYYKSFDENEILIIPNPDKPLCYIVYVVLKDNNPDTLKSFEKYITSYVNKYKIERVNINPVIIDESGQSLNDKKIILTLKLYLGESEDNKSIDKKYLLPFVREFAHDEGRIKKIIERDYGNIPPITCEIFPTINCSNRCPHCSYKMHKIAAGVWSANNTKDKRWHMPEYIVDDLINEIKNAGVKYLLITGGGDPLCNYKTTRKILEKVYDLKKNGDWKEVKYGIYTNAICSKKKFVSLLEYEPEFIRISMNSATIGTYVEHYKPIPNNEKKLIDELEDIDDKDDIKIVKNNIIELLKEKGEKNRKTRIGISYLIDKTTIKDIDEFADWIIDIYNNYDKYYKKPELDFIRFTPVIDYFNNELQQKDDFKDALESIERVINKIKEKGINTEFIVFNHRFNAIDEKKGYEECFGSNFFLEVGCDGNSYICCETTFFPGYNTGNILELEYELIQRSKKYKKLKDLITTSKLKACPVFCKPHNINKILCEIDKQLKTGKKNEIETWLTLLHDYWKWEPKNSKFKKPQIVAF